MAEYVWNGSAWVISPQKKIWNGSSWVEVKGAKIWNGSAWKEYLNASITTGESSLYFPGGKGTEYYTTYAYGYNDGNTYGPPFNAYGSVDGDIIGATVRSCYWTNTIYEVSQTEYELVVVLTGDYSGIGTRAVMIDGTVVTNYKSGAYYPTGGGFDYDNTTIFRYSDPGGDTVPTTNPFGGNGTVTNVQLVSA